VSKHIEAGRDATYQGMKIRHHGDFHLGQVLIAKDDAYILDFEGETRRTLEERRGKEPPARDVAGFLRSIDYAVSPALSRVLNLTRRNAPRSPSAPTPRATSSPPVTGRAIAKRSALRRCGRPTKRRRGRFLIASCSRKRSMKSNTRSATGRPGRTFRSRRCCACYPSAV